MQIPSYPKVHTLGHAAIADLLKDPVVIQEKMDGSQFSFAVLGGELVMRSKNADILPGNVQKQFAPAVETVRRLFDAGLLMPDWIYRAEAMAQPKASTMAYERAPRGGLILFDVDTGLESRNHLVAISTGETLGLEVVPTLSVCLVESLEQLQDFLERESCLGGTKVEGIVIKNYSRWGEKDGKMLMGKWVREEFKEANRKEFKAVDVLQNIVMTYRTEARWRKAVQHLEDAGKLEHSPRDIEKLIVEVQRDIKEEEMEAIQQALWKQAWQKIKRGVTAGFAEWYKERLAERQFDA